MELRSAVSRSVNGRCRDTWRRRCYALIVQSLARHSRDTDRAPLFVEAEVFRLGSAWAAGQTTMKIRSDAHSIAAYQHAGTSELNCRHRRRRSRQVQRGTRAWQCKCARALARFHSQLRSRRCHRAFRANTSRRQNGSADSQYWNSWGCQNKNIFCFVAF